MWHFYYSYSNRLFQPFNFIYYQGSKYWKLSATSVEEGFPRLISDDWEGLPDNLDASFAWTNGKLYFMKGSQYWRFTDVGVLDDGYPKDMRKGFAGIPANVDAALVWARNKKIYFFKGSQYWKLDPDQDPAVPDSYPRKIRYYYMIDWAEYYWVKCTEHRTLHCIALFYLPPFMYCQLSLSPDVSVIGTEYQITWMRQFSTLMGGPISSRKDNITSSTITQYQWRTGIQGIHGTLEFGGLAAQRRKVLWCFPKRTNKDNISDENDISTNISI